MSFEQDLKGGCVTEGSPSLLHEAMDHVKNTWSNVFSGKASTKEYVEAAVEATVVGAVGAVAFKQGMKLFGAESRAGAHVADPELIAKIRAAAKGDLGGLGSKVKLGPDGKPFAAFDLKSLPIPKKDAVIVDFGDRAAKASGLAKYLETPPAANDLRFGISNHEFSHDASWLRPAGMKPPTSPLATDALYRWIPPQIGTQTGTASEIGKSAARAASDHSPIILRVRPPGAA